MASCIRFCSFSCPLSPVCQSGQWFGGNFPRLLLSSRKVARQPYRRPIWNSLKGLMRRQVLSFWKRPSGRQNLLRTSLFLRLLGPFAVRTRSTDDVGIKHNFNKEKRIFARHSDGVDEYPYWSANGDSWIDEGRINAHFLVTMPQGEITTIYNFFAANPLTGITARSMGLIWITIGKWRTFVCSSFSGLRPTLPLCNRFSFGLTICLCS